MEQPLRGDFFLPKTVKFRKNHKCGLQKRRVNFFLDSGPPQK